MLRFVSRQLGATFIAVVVLASVLIISTLADGPNWFQLTMPIVSHGRTDVGYSPTYPVDCTDSMLYNGELLDPSFTNVCAIDSSIGEVTPDGKIIIDGKDSYRLTDKTGSRNNFILPIPNGNGFIQTNIAPTWGAYIFKYSSLSRNSLLRKTYSGVPPRIQYEIQSSPDLQLTDSAGTRIQSSGPPLTFSANGQWMIVDIPYVGLFRVDTEMNEMVPFAKSIEQIAPGKPYYMALSGDGNLVAISTIDSLTLYKLDDCNQHSFTYGHVVSTASCISREIWNDHNGVEGVKQEIGSADIAERLKFIDNDTLKFVARQRNNTNSAYVYNEYYVSAPGAVLHKLAFLGMGDSYISGEGIGTYKAGTDTSDNKCHLSPQSYPYLIGALLYNSYESVACSGAKTVDVDGLSAEYGGQTKIKVKLSARDPNLSTILASFAPGYAQQRHFIKEYIPKTALISVGGNDVQFADMVASCVMPHVSVNTCYNTYEQRIQKAQQIQDSFSDLVSTYKNILNNGTEKLYVVGYPEVAKEDGNCGDNVHLSNDEIKFANLLVHYLNQTIEAAANNAGARYVDIEHALDGHRLCEASGKDVAMNGLTLGNDAGIYVPFADWQLGPLEKASYHPNALGHKLIMETILNNTYNMQQVMPIADSSVKPPQVTDDMPLLAGLTPSQNIPKLKSVDDFTNGTVIRGTPTTLYIDGLEANTLPNSTYQVILHSTPTVLGALTSDANGDIRGTITIPSDISPGIHTINVFGSSFGGEQIQIQQFVYVAAMADDADGDGIPNSQDPCVVISGSSHDIDKDGIDDACDPAIGDIAAASAGNSQAWNGPSNDQNQAGPSAASSTAPIPPQKEQIFSNSKSSTDKHVLGDNAAVISNTAKTKKVPTDLGSSKNWAQWAAVASIMVILLAWLMRRDQYYRRRG